MKKEKYMVILTIPNIDETTIEEAQKNFYAYREKQIIKHGTFEDNIWPISDEYANYNLNFELQEENYREFGQKYNIAYEDFIKFMKTYTICQLGQISITVIQHILLEIKKIVATPFEKLESNEKFSTQYWSRVVEFFSILPDDSNDARMSLLLDKMDLVMEKNFCSNNGQQRSLGYFESYFRFDDILKKFWRSANKEEKLFYFPIWLWWNLSAILPMRPREFVLTPRNCVDKIDGEYYLSVRKDKLKGSKKNVSYKINDDYEICKYQITKELANEIIWYQEETKNFEHTQLNTLLVTDMHYLKWDRCKPYTSRFFTYINLKTCLRYFYEQIIQERYKYKIIFEKKQMNVSNEKEIEFIHLGDTRHLALINLMIEGATPMVAMMLAGHDNPEMTSHYYSNISTLIECRTYRQYKKLINGKQTYKLSTKGSKMKIGNFVLLEDNSRCYSKNMYNHNFADCYKVIGPAGEIGFCTDCVYHRAEGKKFTDSKEIYKNRVEYECRNLEEIIKRVRCGKGEQEEIIQILLRLKDESYSYQQYLLETKEIEYVKE